MTEGMKEYLKERSEKKKNFKTLRREGLQRLYDSLVVAKTKNDTRQVRILEACIRRIEGMR